MKSFAIPLVALAMASCATTRPSELHFRLEASGNAMALAGTKYTSLDSFLAAVAELPPGSRLVWRTGCLVFAELPLGSQPRMTLPVFKAYCRSHGITFDYQWGISPDKLVVKTFPVSAALSTANFDARTWLEDRGVTFPPGSFARWEPIEHALVVRNTESDLDLVSSIVKAK